MKAVSRWDSYARGIFQKPFVYRAWCRFGLQTVFPVFPLPEGVNGLPSKLVECFLVHTDANLS